MKNLLALGTVAALITAASTHAADNVQIPLSGTLDPVCNVTVNLNGPFDDLDMTSTATQGNEGLRPVCNYAGTLTVTFVSANGGFLVSGQNSVGYTLQIGNGALLSPTQLLAPTVIPNWPSTVAKVSDPRAMKVALLAAATAAGTYTDTITASVTPN